MILSPEDSSHYYKLLFRLQYYVLKKTDQNTTVNSLKQYIGLSKNDKMKTRDEVWANNNWIDEYVELNPDNLLEEELELIKKWKERIEGKFFIVKILKKYSVFIMNESEVYGVIGITEELDEVIDKNKIPMYVETVLLPFKDKIIYDGILSNYAISFGSGMRESFRETYNSAKVNNQIITSL